MVNGFYPYEKEREREGLFSVKTKRRRERKRRKERRKEEEKERRERGRGMVDQSSGGQVASTVRAWPMEARPRGGMRRWLDLLMVVLWVFGRGNDFGEIGGGIDGGGRCSEVGGWWWWR